jgi:hypothetical protein
VKSAVRDEGELGICTENSILLPINTRFERREAEKVAEIKELRGGEGRDEGSSVWGGVANGRT